MPSEKENPSTNTEEHDVNPTPTDPPTSNEQEMNAENPDDNTGTDTPLDDAEMDTQPHTFDSLYTGIKRQLRTDSDSDNSKPKPQRRQKIKPTPNLAAARPQKDSKGTQDHSSKQ